jgi:cephalosporin-C deacetylase-like acetyl esterase
VFGSFVFGFIVFYVSLFVSLCVVAQAIAYEDFQAVWKIHYEEMKALQPDLGKRELNLMVADVMEGYFAQRGEFYGGPPTTTRLVLPSKHHTARKSHIHIVDLHIENYFLNMHI